MEVCIVVRFDGMKAKCKIVPVRVMKAYRGTAV
jgi:hypothetical protein